MKNIHKGETCLVIGNGPSLADIPNEFLNKYPSFGTNRIYLKEGFTPTYYVAVNENIIRQSLTEIQQMDAIKFIRKGWEISVPGSYPITDNQKLSFSLDPLKGLYEGFSVTYTCLQLAFWMGFKVLLIGLDHRYNFDGNPNELKSTHDWKGNHFDKNYYKPGEVANNPDHVRSEQAFQLAREQFGKSRRLIRNITPDSALDVFKKESWKKW